MKGIDEAANQGYKQLVDLNLITVERSTNAVIEKHENGASE
ncbi:hypothetical protein [uncultured Arcticibacterium sp.]